MNERGSGRGNVAVRSRERLEKRDAFINASSQPQQGGTRQSGL